MRNFIRHKTRITAIKHPALLRGLALIIAVCALIRGASALGAERAAGGLMEKLGGSAAAMGILDFELGGTALITPQDSLASLLFETPALSSGAVGGFSGDIGGYSDSGADMTESPGFSNEQVSEDIDKSGELFYGGTPPASAAPSETPLPLNVTQPKSAQDILIDNRTDYAIDAGALLNEPLGITLDSGEPAVLIIHTHTSEAYTQSGSDTYEESDPFRTEDQTKNITRVGDEIAAVFEAHGISVIHDTSSYDFPSYTGSYTRSYDSIQAYLDKYPSIKLVLDIHRDSIATPDGKQYKTVAQIGDVRCSQVMMVVGTDSAGLTHTKWRENLKLALHLQHEMNVLSPTLTRPVRISEYRYNQQATTGSLIIEVGCAGNTLDESVTAARYFADAASNVILGLYE